MNEIVPIVTPWLPAILVLISLSALFSGSEAALFSLSLRDRRLLARSGSGPRAAVRLLETPERLLSAILFWNLTINMTYFAIASVIGGRIRKLEIEGSESAEFLFAAVALISIIFFSEMLPKSLGVVAPLAWSRWCGLPLETAVRIASPILPLLSTANLLARRLFWPGFTPESQLHIEDLERAIQLSTGDVDLAARERDTLRRLVALGDIRVGEWMRPRSTLTVLEGEVDAGRIRDASAKDGYVYFIDADTGEIGSCFAAHTARPSHFEDPADALESLLLVPWSASVATVLERLHDEDRDAAGVVNEYGETVGVLTIDDILEGVLRDDLGGTVGIEPQEPGRWIVDGGISIRALARRLEVELPSGRNVTVTGVVQEQNRRFARPGDGCELGPLRITMLETESERPQFEVERREEEAPES